MRRLGRQHFPGIPDENFHSLLFWAEVLELTRNYAGRPLPAALLAMLHSSAARIGAEWWVEMRYRPTQAAAMYTIDVYNDVSWIRLNHHALWS